MGVMDTTTSFFGNFLNLPSQLFSEGSKTPKTTLFSGACTDFVWSLVSVPKSDPDLGATGLGYRSSSRCFALFFSCLSSLQAQFPIVISVTVTLSPRQSRHPERTVDTRLRLRKGCNRALRANHANNALRPLGAKRLCTTPQTHAHAAQ